MAKYQKYAEYKDSGVEWLGRVPSHWIITTLKRYCYVKGGFAFSSDAFIDTGYPVIRIGDIKTDGSINLENCKYIPESLAVNSHDYLVEKNQLLMAMTGATIGKAGLYTSNEPAFLNQRVGKFELLAQNMNYRYLWYILKTDGYQEYIKLTAFGGAQPNISDTAMVDYPATIPSFDEQTKIANFLDHETAQIDTLIAKQEKLIELLKEKRQAVISHAVTKGLDPNVPMKDSGVEWLGEVPEHWIVAGFKKYLSSIVDYRGKTPEKVDEGIFLVTARNIKKGKIDYSLSQEYVSDNDYDQIMSRGSPLIGDVLFTTEAPLGEVSQVDRTDIALAQRIIKFRGQDNVLDNTFLKFFMMSTSFQDSLMTFASGSTALGIKAERLGYLKQLIPPLNEQQEIVKHIEKCVHQFDGLEKKMRDAISLIQERRTALISAAVTGKIDVRNWQAPMVADAHTELSA